jgi:cyclic dehypoxanthinyl futalosine synthase
MLVLRNNLLVQQLISKSDVGDILNSALCGQDLGLNECIKLIKFDDVYSIGLVGNILRTRLYEIPLHLLKISY